MNDQKRFVMIEADAIVETFPESGLGALADDMERKLRFYDQGEACGRAVVAELRARDQAGVRFWPIDPATVPIEDLIDDEIPW